MPYEEVVQAPEEARDPVMFNRDIYDESVTVPVDTFAELPSHDPVEEALHRAGVRGAPIAAYTVGRQECVVVDVSSMPLEEDGRRDMFLPEYGPMTGLGRIPDPGEGLPTLAVVHFRNRGHGGVDVRPLVPTQPVMHGRASERLAKEGDPMANTGFDYGTDETVSSLHASVLLDPGTRSLIFTDMGSTNKTPLRYMSRPASSTPVGAQPVRDTEQPPQVQVEATVESPEVQRMIGFTSTMSSKLAEVLSRGSLTVDELEFVEAVTNGGSRIANGLVGDSMKLPKSDSWAHHNMQHMIEVAGIVINNSDPQTQDAFNNRFPPNQPVSDHLLQERLQWLFGVMSMIPGGSLSGRDRNSALLASQGMGAYSGRLLTFIDDMVTSNGRVPIGDRYLQDKLPRMTKAYDRVNRQTT